MEGFGFSYKKRWTKITVIAIKTNWKIKWLKYMVEVMFFTTKVGFNNKNIN